MSLKLIIISSINSNCTYLKGEAAADTINERRITIAVKFEIYKDKSGQFRWRLVHTNGQIIANSGESYKAKKNAMGGIKIGRRKDRLRELDIQISVDTCVV
ncbi:MAG: hypothetical protein A2158_07240 [Chloroflexi bacterium RBG_13_46_14]|nr:MAG: hypothetical protein A2158_07240 [Chloroflexi bacterium RBG_13_46_14]